jgi:hypothetical protein
LSVWLDADGDPLPDSLALKPRRLKWLAIFLIALGFVSIAVFLGDDMDPLARWGSGGFFALCAAITVPQFIGVGSKLELDPKGFKCASLFKSFRREWADCSEFSPVRIGPNMMVGFSTGQDETAHPRGAAFARALTGTSGALPDTYGVSADELADLMNRFRARALGIAP